MSQNISHQPQNYKSTWWIQSKNFKPVLSHTKPTTIFTKTISNTVQILVVKGKKWRCEIENRAVSFLNNVVRVFLLVRTGFSSVLNLMFYFNWYCTDEKWGWGGELTSIVKRVTFLISKNIFTGHPDPFCCANGKIIQFYNPWGLSNPQRRWGGHWLVRNINFKSLVSQIYWLLSLNNN